MNRLKFGTWAGSSHFNGKFAVYFYSSIIQEVLSIYCVASSGLSAMKLETILSQRACYLGRETQWAVMGWWMSLMSCEQWKRCYAVWLLKVEGEAVHCTPERARPVVTPGNEGFCHFRKDMSHLVGSVSLSAKFEGGTKWYVNSLTTYVLAD